MRGGGTTAPDVARRGWRDWARVGAAATLLLVLAVLAARLALAPIHAVRSAAGCARAYAAAQTHGDTVTADLLTYAWLCLRPAG